MSLYGIQESGNVPETLGVISKLSPFISEFQGTFNVQNVAGVLQGMQKLKSGVPQVDELLVALAPHIERASGVFNSKGLSMTLSGLQGMDSKQPEVRTLISSLASLIEKSEFGFSGFEDFHQISTAFSGLAGMSSEHSEVRKLVDAIAKVVKPLLSKAVEKAVEKVPEVAAPAAVRQWQQGKGVVVVDDLAPAAVVVAVEKAVEKVEKKPIDRLARMLRDEPKPDKVGMALYGMQGLSSRQDSARILMDLLVPFVRKMPAPSGKVLGMALQGFKSCTGKPPGSHAAVLTILASKVSGYSTRKGRVVGANGKENGVVVVTAGEKFVASGDAQVTFRSGIWGVSNLDREAPSVRAILKSLAVEALQWNPKELDKRTYSSIAEVYQGGDIEADKDVAALLEQVAPFMPARKIMDPSLSRNSSSITTETNNKRNPSSSNKNKPLGAVATTPRLALNANATKMIKPKQPKTKTNKTTTTTASASVAAPKAKKVKNVAVAVVLGEGEVAEEKPKISRRLKIQNKLEKRMKAADAAGEAGGEGVAPPVAISAAVPAAIQKQTPTQVRRLQ
jgi:hypothetical protein